jgi:DNA-binding winged helix-turn-helix (wHTH) protein
VNSTEASRWAIGVYYPGKADRKEIGVNGRDAMSTLRFGAFTLDLTTGELRKGATVVGLSPQPFTILALLANQAGQLVTRQDIQRHVWRSETFVDFDGSINRCIKQIRIALDDDADTPRFIETLARRGYRFIAAVSAGHHTDYAAARLPPPESFEGELRPKAPPPGGALSVTSSFYIVRAADAEFQSAVARQDSIVLVKGPRQVGKTSLLARGLQRARNAGSLVVVTDFQKFAISDLASVEPFLLALAISLADQLNLEVSPEAAWNTRLSPTVNFERYLRRTVFASVPTPIVWALDEVDRLLSCAFGSEVFGLFRSWHNERALDPEGSWRRLTLAMAYATEAHLFITDLNQSPFNVGTRILLGDFSRDQVAELNRCYGSPLHDASEIERYFGLVGGHPYLVQRGLYEMSAHGLPLSDLEARANHDQGPFGDHLRRLFVSVTRDKSLHNALRAILQREVPDAECMYRLRSAGLISGDSVHDVKPRCQLYTNYFAKQLL